MPTRLDRSALTRRQSGTAVPITDDVRKGLLFAEWYDDSGDVTVTNLAAKKFGWKAGTIAPVEGIADALDPVSFGIEAASDHGLTEGDEALVIKRAGLYQVQFYANMANNPTSTHGAVTIKLELSGGAYSSMSTDFHMDRRLYGWQDGYFLDQFVITEAPVALGLRIANGLLDASEDPVDVDVSYLSMFLFRLAAFE